MITDLQLTGGMSRVAYWRARAVVAETELERAAFRSAEREKNNALMTWAPWAWNSPWAEGVEWRRAVPYYREGLENQVPVVTELIELEMKLTELQQQVVELKAQLAAGQAAQGGQANV